MLKELDPGSWKPGEGGELKGGVSCEYYKLTHDSRVIHEIDVPNMVRVIDGVDQLEQTRVNLGL